MYRSDDYYRELIFYEWFEKNDKRYTTMRDGKMCDISVTVKYAPFISTFASVYRKYKRYYDTAMDCYSECMSLVWEGLLRFKIHDDSTWERIATGQDLDNYRKLVSYLKSHVMRTIKKLNQDCIETTRTLHDGNNRRKLHLYYNISPESLNKLITFDNSMEQVEIISTIENSYWEEKANYRYGLFADWVRQHLDEYLTKSQMELLSDLRDANYSSLDNEWDSDSIENSRGQIKLRLERICDKVTSKYCEQRKLVVGGYVIQEIDAEIKSLKKFTNALDDSDNVASDVVLSQIVLSSMNNKYWERLLYEDLSKESLEYIIDAQYADSLVYEDTFKLFTGNIGIDRKALYEVANSITARLEYLYDAREYEMSIISRRSTKSESSNYLGYEIPQGNNEVYLRMTPLGTLVGK